MKTMKIMKRLMGCAAAILALTACSESEDLLAAYHSDSKAVHITAQVGKASADGFTRSNPLGDAKKQTEFNENDEISVQAEGQEAVTYQFNGSEWLPKESSKFLKWEKETMDFTAYYPASFNGTITQPEKYNSEADLAAADFMSFKGPQENKNNNKLTLTMEREMARVVVEIADFNDQYAGATVNNVSSLSICGVKAYKHTDNKFYALIKPCAAQNSQTFISLDVAEGEGESKTTKTEKLTGIPELVAGKSYTYKLTVGKNKISVSGISVADWTPREIIPDDNKAKYTPYLTFKAERAQTFKMTVQYGYKISKLEYSVNGGDWTLVEPNTEVPFGGDKGDLRLRGTNSKGTASSWNAYSTITFTENAPVACTGDIRTLLDWSNYNKVETQNAKFCNLFDDCRVLTSAPELPATSLAEYCYKGMFHGCTNLTSAPVLPATTLAYGCYSSMFHGCTNLTSAPKLSAEKLADACYANMFYNCKRLSTVTMLAPASEINSSSQCCSLWLGLDAGTDASSRTIKVQDADAYNALVDKGWLPDNWKKSDTGATVLFENNGK